MLQMPPLQRNQMPIVDTKYEYVTSWYILLHPTETIQQRNKVCCIAVITLRNIKSAVITLSNIKSVMCSKTTGKSHLTDL